jgi:beta-glucanase (GH16 family)
VVHDPAVPGNYLHTNIGTEARYTFRYGYAEARMRFHEQAGAHAAFWLLTPDEYVAEVDVAEVFGKPVVHHNVYAGALGQATGVQVQTRDIDPGSWHRYGVWWTPNRIRFYVDREMVHEVWVSDRTTKFLVLSQQVKDFDLAHLDPTRLRGLTVDVDSVTVWRNR